MPLTLTDITESDWNAYLWTEIELEPGKRVFLRGVQRTSPPNDGFHYVDVTGTKDTVQQWARAQEAQ